MNATLSLETERLTLREFVETDFGAVHAYASDLEVVRFMPWGPNTPEDTQAFLARTIARYAETPRTHYDFAIGVTGSGRLVGGCSLRVTSEEHREGSIGYCLHRGVWGRGIATEAARALLALGFGELGLHRVFAMCDAENVRSARVMEKVGMVREGRLREHRCIRGRWRDSLVYGLLDREWDRLQTAHIPCSTVRLEGAERAHAT